MISLEAGKKLVKLARTSVEEAFQKKNTKDNEFKEKSGCFVTLTKDNSLRGCIGFSEAKLPLGEAVISAARYAAFSDPRFAPLKKEELKKILFEVSVLTEPELIKVNSPEEYKQKIKIGRDGLIAEIPPFRGLLLPQVFNKDDSVEKALSMTCNKANLLEDTWKQGECNIYKFQAQIFSELTPNGEITEKTE